MSKKLTKSYLIMSIAILAALAVVLDVFSDALPLRVIWGMKIDFVGTVWVLSYFLYGLSVAFPVSVTKGRDKDRKGRLNFCQDFFPCGLGFSAG